MLGASALGVAHGPRVLFDDLSIRLLPSQRTALVGGNGEGKTTLLEILVGTREPDSGEVHRPKDLRIGYLPQDLETAVEGTVIEETMGGADFLTEVADELAGLEARLGDVDDPEHDRILDRYGRLQSRFEQLGGYALEAEAHRILSGLGFAPDAHDRPVREMSGGWRMRVALARLLLSGPDVLILDEPTNHLDVDSVAWLEQHLASWPGALLFVSHDRDFIDAIANRIIELDRGSATEYAGAFAEYVVAREERLLQLEAAARQQAKKVAHTERFIERFRYKATKARQVQSRVKTLEKLDAIEVPTRKELQAKFAFPEPQRSSRVVAELSDVSVGYDDGTDVLTGVDLVIERGMKVGLVGPNGAGKTTLIKLLLGELEASSGSVSRGANVDVAQFAQRQTENLDLSLTVIEEFKRKVPEKDGRNMRTVLGAFGFRGEAGDQRISALSGGERTRLALAETMAEPVNLLVLDEPTNHLDLPSCDLLEDALVAYPGTVLIVSHDRHLIRNVADCLVEVRDGTARFHPGVDEKVLSPRSAAEPEVDARPAPTASKKKSTPNKKAAKRQESAEDRKQRNAATRDLRKQVAKVEKAWEAAEAEVADIQAQMADPATYDDATLIAELSKRHDEAKDTAARLMADWETAMRRLDRADS